MELGEKLRQARLEAGLSQRQLCAEEITRNMLSLIESGKAKPSMDTLRYLASRLGKPMAYFLEEDGAVSPNQRRMDSARAAYAAGAYRQTLEILTDYEKPDSMNDAEFGLLSALSLLALAKQAIAEDRLIYARELLNRMETCETPYLPAYLEREQRLLLAQTGAQVQVDVDERFLLVNAQQALAGGNAHRCICLLEAMEQRDGVWHLLRGQAAAQLRDYAAAVSYLQEAENTQPQKARPLLEHCFRELEDYKMAYHYACKQREN